MGRERSRARQYLHFCTAVLIVVALAACAPLRTMLEERDGRIHLQQVRLLTRQGDFSGAIRENRMVLDRSPKSPPADAALFSMGLIYADHANPAKDYKKALGFFTQLVKDFPQSPFAEESGIWVGVLSDEVSPEREGRAFLQQLQLLTRQGDFDGAVRENQKVLALSPKSPLADAALFSMGLIYADRANPAKDYRKALDYFTQLVKDFPRSPFADDGRLWAGVLENEIVGQEGLALLQRMQLLTRHGDFKGALSEDQKVLALSPHDSPGDGALFSMGLIYADCANPERDYGKALGFFRLLAKDFPRSPLAEGARVWAGVLANEVSPEREGLAHLQEMQQLSRKGEFDSALRENQRVLDRSSKSPPADAALFSLGLIYADRSNPKMDYRKALSFFTRLKREFPGSPFVDEAKVWTGVLETMEKAMRVDIEVEQKKNELRR